MKTLEEAQEFCEKCSERIMLFTPMDMQDVDGCEMFMPAFRLTENEKVTETHTEADFYCFCSAGCREEFKNREVGI